MEGIKSSRILFPCVICLVLLAWWASPEAFAGLGSRDCNCQALRAVVSESRRCACAALTSAAPSVLPLAWEEESYVGKSQEDEQDEEEDDEGEEDRFVMNVSNSTRLDAFLADRYGQSRSYIDRLIDEELVLVNGKLRKKSWRGLRGGDDVKVQLRQFQREPLSVEGEKMPLEVIAEDEDLLVLNKPANLVVHPCPGHWRGTLVNGVVHYLGATGSSNPDKELPRTTSGALAQLRPGIVHRLDVDTTGVIIVCKTSLAFAALSLAFKRREVKKTYLAVAAGVRDIFRGSGYLIDMPLGRDPQERLKRAQLPIAAGGRASQTVVQSLAEHRVASLSLLEAKPRTGRTHQLRVHLAEMETPVLGDATYGRPGYNQRYAKMAHRPLLHARRIEFAHPRDGRPVVFQAPLPADMQGAVEHIIAGDDWLSETGQEDLRREVLGDATEANP